MQYTSIDHPSGIQNGNCTGSAGYFNGKNYNQVTCASSVSSSYTAYLNYLKMNYKLSNSTEIGSLNLMRLEKLGCSLRDESDYKVGDCMASNHPWVYSSSYEIEIFDKFKYAVLISGDIGPHTFPLPYGVRPVITVLKSDIQL